MKWRLLSLISIFLIGCGPDGDDLEDLEDLDALLEEAFDISKIQERGEGDQALIYAHNKQQPYTGWVKIFHPNGQVKQLWEVEDGKSDGDFTGWHENGQKACEVVFKDGEENGEDTAWYDNGQKAREGEYKKGKRHGNLTTWYENGQKSSESEWENGKLLKARSWLPNGTDCPDTNLQDGNGIIVWYDKDGEESERSVYKDGIHLSSE